MQHHEQGGEASTVHGSQPSIDNHGHGKPPDTLQGAPDGGGILQVDKNDPETRYWVGRQIGRGSFGAVYKAIRLSDSKEVAVKFEPNKSAFSHLREETRTYKILKDTKSIPEFIYFGEYGCFRLLVMELLGPSMETLFNLCKQKFTIGTVVRVGIQMLTTLESLHRKGLIHRDIKPENFLLRWPDEIIIADLAMAERFENVDPQKQRGLTGTARYMSINTHLGQPPSRRDDLESLWYVLLYFIRGGLPWEGINAEPWEKYDKIYRAKESADIEDLCEGRPRFCQGLLYIRGLSFAGEPDYDFLRAQLSGSLSIEPRDVTYDWGKLPGLRSELLEPVQATDAVGPNERRPIAPGRSREEILKGILEASGELLGGPFFTKEQKPAGSRSIFYSAEAQECLAGVSQFAKGFGFRLKQLQKPIWWAAKLQALSDDIEGTTSSPSVDPAVDTLSKALSPIVPLSVEVSWEILSKGGSGRRTELMACLQKMKGLVEGELQRLMISEDRPLTPVEHGQPLKRTLVLSPGENRASKRRSGENLRDGNT